MAPSLGLISLAIVLIPTVRWFWRAWQVNVPPAPYAYLATWAVGTVLAAIALAQDLGTTAAGVALGVGFFVLYFVSTGAQKVADSSVAVGDTLPAFTATDEHDATFDSASLAGSPFLLKFFRGHW